ncbi:hypothetical protein V8J82_04585 [Gymnodinialimonas sp. 2305UL16-5]|uniref:hypothetical protein n=1 Tax=Gymnodinialimonas mytili TaxID=3126503 RepID=UPI0030B3CAB1
MRLALLTTAALAAFALPAAAQSELERLETASEAAGQNMATFMIARAPQLEPVMVDWEWDEEMREVGQCTLNEIRSVGGDQAATDYVVAMEAFATTQITSMEQMGAATPVPLNEDVAMTIATTCRAMEVSMRRMEESGMMQMMMDPATMQALMSE